MFQRDRNHRKLSHFSEINTYLQLTVTSAGANTFLVPALPKQVYLPESYLSTPDITRCPMSRCSHFPEANFAASLTRACLLLVVL